jgi:uncharacterized protein YggE
MDPLFEFHRLNEAGVAKANAVASAFDELLRILQEITAEESTGRPFAIVRTKLEEACFFAKKAVAINPANQEH